MFTKYTGCRTSTSKTSDIRGRVIFGCQGYNLNKVGRGSQDNATNIISRSSGFRPSSQGARFFKIDLAQLFT